MVIGVAMASLTAIGCGKSEEQKAAEKLVEAQKQLVQAATQTANSAAAQGMAQGANAMAAMANAMAPTGPDGKPLPPVDFEKLVDLLPNVPGWEKGKPTGSTTTMMGNMSIAEARYTKGDEHVKLTLTDASMARLFLAPMLVWTNGFNQRSTEGYKKSTTVSGFPGWEEWNTEGKHGEISAIVGNRFMAQASGSSLSSIDSAKGILTAVDLNKLATLK
jgi:hypothetical protein